MDIADTILMKVSARLSVDNQNVYFWYVRRYGRQNILVIHLSTDLVPAIDGEISGNRQKRGFSLEIRPSNQPTSEPQRLQQLPPPLNPTTSQ